LKELREAGCRPFIHKFLTACPAKDGELSAQITKKPDNFRQDFFCLKIIFSYNNKAL